MNALSECTSRIRFALPTYIRNLVSRSIALQKSIAGQVASTNTEPVKNANQLPRQPRKLDPPTRATSLLASVQAMTFYLDL
jgi:hypothetical protein